MIGNRIQECTLCGMEADKHTGKWLHAPALSHLECAHIWCSNPKAKSSGSNSGSNKNYTDIPDLVIKLIIKME